MANNRCIGSASKLPWRVSQYREDMQHFKKITCDSEVGKRNAVIMGNNTFKSIGSKPLPHRYNILLTHDTVNKNIRDNGIIMANNFDAALDKCQTNNIDKIYVIGGQQIYRHAIDHRMCDKIYLTTIDETYDGDKFFPELPDNYHCRAVSQLRSDIRLEVWQNKFDGVSQEYCYLDCMRKILNRGHVITDRTKVGVISRFAENLKFDIRCTNPEEIDICKRKYRIPVYTTKKIAFRSVILELLWFLRGSTNVTWLQDKNVHIWDGHSSQNYLTSRGLDYDAGIIGPAYGHQWINWGGEYNPDGGVNGGINQIDAVIELLKHEPNSRRAIISAWNVSDLDKMALPPCHVMYIFNIIDSRLNCQLILRSNDMFLGNPFNVASASVLMILLARAIGVEPGTLAVSIANAHIYNNHIQQVLTQLDRTPYYFPSLTIDANIESYQDIIKLRYNNFRLHDYLHWPIISAEMAI